ncbi:hypothetical protein YC2023_045264 [Brassica napus]
MVGKREGNSYFLKARSRSVWRFYSGKYSGELIRMLREILLNWILINSKWFIMLRKKNTKERHESPVGGGLRTSINARPDFNRIIFKLKANK